MSTRAKALTEIIQDAGYENAKAKYKFLPQRGWYMVDGKEERYLGGNYDEALAEVLKMVGPEKEAEAEAPRYSGRVSPETNPELYDEFGNPVKSPFGSS